MPELYLEYDGNMKREEKPVSQADQRERAFLFFMLSGFDRSFQVFRMLDIGERSEPTCICQASI